MNKARLLKLAAFLDKLPRKKFDFAVITDGSDVPRKELDCGTTGCAIGWCPIAFPKDFAYKKRRSYFGDIEIAVCAAKNGRRSKHEITLSRYYGDEHIHKFFGIDHVESVGLFFPGYQAQIGYKNLGDSATPKQVAGLIRRFVAKRAKATSNS